MFYMVNPSELPKKRKKNKSRRRNPELLIVNPYSLEDSDKQKKKAKMAKRKRKSRKSKSKSRSRRSSKRRKNPLARRRRKNPLTLGSVKDKFLGPNLENVKQAAMMAVGGGTGLAVGTAAFGSRLGGGNVGKGLVAVLSGVVGGVIVSKIGESLLPGNEMVQQLAVSGAMGAMVLGAWAIAQPMVEPWADKLNAKLGFAGLGSWGTEFEAAGFGNYGSVYEEFTPNVSPGMGLFQGNQVAAIEENPFIGVAGMDGYEPLGDIYNSQRLGSFEAEPGFHGFVPEHANPRDQQPADVMKHAAGHYGGYEGVGQFDTHFDSLYVE